jgi:hypothetical protein
MNYCVVAFALALAGLILQWRLDIRHHCAGPKLDSYNSLLACDSSKGLAEYEDHDDGDDGDDGDGGGGGR